MADSDIEADDAPEEEADVEEGDEEAPPSEKGDSEEGKPDEDDPTKVTVSEEGKPDEDDPTKVTVPVRSTAVAQHIIARQKGKIEELRKSKSEPTSQEAEEDDEEGDEPELSPEALRAIDKRLGRAINPLLSRLTSQADSTELKEFITATPEAKPFEKRIKAFMEHDAYRQIPPEVIFHHLAFAQAQKIGAARRTNADREAAQTRSGGTRPKVSRPLGKLTAEDIENMSDKELTELQSKVFSGKL